MGGAKLIGIPRSRTYWFSRLLSHGGHTFMHEGVNGCADLKQYIEKTKNCGDCTTAFMNYNLNKMFPSSRVLIVHKDEAGIKRTAKWAFDAYRVDMFQHFMEASENLRKIDGLHINYCDIDKKAHEIWEYLRGDTPDAERIKRYSGLVLCNDSFIADIESAKRFMNDISPYRF